MKIIKEIFKYIAVFLLVITFLTIILTLVASIPRKYVEKNLKEATSYFEKNMREITRIHRKKQYTFLHPYADGIILNIIYCLDTENPLKSVLEAKYFADDPYDGSNQKYLDLIENNYEGNTEYVRYWHGSIIIIKLLLMIFTLEQIYIFSAIILGGLIIAQLIILLKNKLYSIAISLIIGLIMIAIWYVPFSFEYIWPFFIMFIVSIISTNIEIKNRTNKNQKLYILFFITGILTCFFDFLTTEILTILFPLVIIISIRLKNNEIKNFKEIFIFLFKSMILWFVAYAFTWIAKWLFASIILKTNVTNLVKDKAMLRVNGQVFDYSKIELMIQAIKENIITLFLVSNLKNKMPVLITIIISIFTTTILIFDRKNKTKRNYALILCMIAIIPYLRYIVLSNHSYRHMFFTFRSQLPTIMSLVLIIINCADKEKLFSNINLKNKNT